MAAGRPGRQTEEVDAERHGTARYARDARIATAADLRDAPIALQWQAQKLLRDWDVHMTGVGHEPITPALVFGAPGYRPPYPPTWSAAAERMLAHEARYLAEADLYVLTPPMCDVVVAAALSLAVHDLELMDADDLEGRAGLLVLPYPLPITTIGGNLAHDRAHAWHAPASTPRRTSAGRSASATRCLGPAAV